MPQTSRFISPPKARCDLRAGSAVIRGFPHERAAADSALRGTVCPADVGQAAVHIAHLRNSALLKAFNWLFLKTFYSMKNVNKFVITDALL